ncbi:MAG: glutamate--cysteine ligase, partial [Candidatus Dadabacteria bacterium]|nr:glutamate--cysteine ligase [Candidatus Dadabacteria bacterium]
MPSFDEINECIAEGSVEIESWVSRQRKKVEVPLYTSVDVRISKHKIAPVDTNIFPAGFNNLSADCRLHASELFKNYFALKYPEIEKILIIPELHTRNTYYWENIHVLKSILTTVGFEVEVGLISDDLRSDSVELKTSSGGVVTARSLRRSGSCVHTSNFRPDLLLINNDFSDKYPEILREIVQPVEPPVELGWHSRRKDIHFEFYNKLAYEVARMVDIDPWVFTLETIAVKGVDFDSPRDREWVADVVDEVLESLREQYSSRGIDEEPFVIIKSNYGTYGMAVISVVGGDDVRRLNAEGRKKMRVAKGGMIVRDVVVQEGVHTSL